MTGDILCLLAILAAALVLFAFEWIAADVVALGILLSLAITGLLPLDRAFAGFGSDAFMMILGLLIMTAALLRTGFVDIAGRLILRHSGEDPGRLLLIVMIAVAALSAFISNTAATAFFLPVVFGIAKRARQSPSKLLLPLAFASILSSSCTLVSTSTNLVVSHLLARHSHQGQLLKPMGMFELAPVGIPIAVAGIAYMWFLGRRLIRDRAETEDETEDYGLRPYLTEVLILPGSRLAGKSLAEANLGRDLDLLVVRIVRDKHTYVLPLADIRLQVGDVLLVEGPTESILKIKDEAGIDIKADAKLSDPALQAPDLGLVEAILLPGSPLIGRTLKSSRFRERYGLQVLAVKRAGGTRVRKISEIRLRMGDILLLQGHRANIRALAESEHLSILGAVEHERPNWKKAPVAAAIFVLALAAATFNLLTLPIAALLGAVLTFLTRCITPEEAYRGIEWKALIMIGSLLGLGAAMEHTGTDRLLASVVVRFAGSADPMWLLAGFFVLTVLLTQPMSNQAAAVIVFPFAMQTADQLGLNPRTFAMMIAVAASCSFLTPLEPSCLMVYGPGRYRFLDFLKVGGLLTVIIFLIAMALVPVFWPLQP